MTSDYDKWASRARVPVGSALAFIGMPGSGKSYWAMQVAVEALAAGHPVTWVSPFEEAEALPEGTRRIFVADAHNIADGIGAQPSGLVIIDSLDAFLNAPEDAYGFASRLAEELPVRVVVTAFSPEHRGRLVAD